MLYLLIFIGLMCLSYNYDYLGKKAYRISWYILVLIVFILVAGLRYRIGIDSIRYESEYADMPGLDFYQIKKYYEYSRYNIGFIIAAALGRSISDSFVVYQFLEAIYVNCILFWFFNKYTRKIFLAVLLYFTLFYFNFMCEIMREAWAAATLLLAYPYFVKGDWVKYYAISLLALCFHISAAICLVLPILYLPGIRSIFTFGKKTAIILVGLILIMSIVAANFFTFISMYLSIVGGVEDLVKSYQDSKLSESVFNIKGVITFLIKNIIYPFVAILLIKREKRLRKGKGEGVDPHLEFMVAIFCYIAIISIPIALLYRLCNYFVAFSIIAICNATYKKFSFKGTIYKLKYLTWVVVFSPLVFLRLYSYMEKVPDSDRLRNGRVYYPYSSRLNPEKDAQREEIFRLFDAN